MIKNIQLDNLFNTNYGQYIIYENKDHIILATSLQWFSHLRWIFTNSTFDHIIGGVYINPKDMHLIKIESKSFSQRLQNIYISLLLKDLNIRISNFAAIHNVDFIIIDSPFENPNPIFKIFNIKVNYSQKFVKISSKREDLIFCLLFIFNFQSIYSIIRETPLFTFNIPLHNNDLFGVIKSYMHSSTEIVEVVIEDGITGPRPIVLPTIDDIIDFGIIKLL